MRKYTDRVVEDESVKISASVGKSTTPRMTSRSRSLSSLMTIVKRSAVQSRTKRSEVALK